MSGPEIEPLRLFAQFHGHLGWLAAVALIHPAVLLRKPKRKAGLAVSLALGLVSAGALSGALLYPTYRERLKPAIFQTAPLVGWMFERKEHLAFGAAMLAWIGVLTAVAGRRTKDEAAQLRLGKASHRAFVAAAAMAVVTACLGTWVASVKSF